MSEVYEMNIDEIEKYIIGKKIKDMSLEEIKKFIEAQGNTIILNHHVLEKQQQELDKYKNIVDEIKKDLYNILHNLEKYDETAGYVPEHLEYATNYTEQAIDKLKKLKGE